MLNLSPFIMIQISRKLGLRQALVTLVCNQGSDILFDYVKMY